MTLIRAGALTSVALFMIGCSSQSQPDVETTSKATRKSAAPTEARAQSKATFRIPGTKKVNRPPDKHAGDGGPSKGTNKVKRQPADPPEAPKISKVTLCLPGMNKKLKIL